MKKDLQSLSLPTLLLVTMHLIPLCFLQPFWLTAICGTLILVRYFQTGNGAESAPVSRWVLWALRIGIGFCIWQSYQSVLADAAAGAFAIMLASVKIYDLHKKNDFFFVAIYCLVTLMSDLLVQSSWLLATVLFFNAFAVLFFLFAVQQGRWSGRAWREPALKVAGTVMKTIPVVAILYAIFPRNNAEFGRAHIGFAKTGITDSLQPGSVSELAASDELVFRAHFLKNKMKNTDQLYWRGAVLDISNGLNWGRRKSDVAKIENGDARAQDPEVQVDLEPGSDRFLFTLENLGQVSLPPNSDYKLNSRAGQIFELSESLHSRDQYFLQAQSPAPEKDQAADYLKVGEAPSLELNRFLNPLHGKPDQVIVQELLRFFGHAGFKYSMQPPKVTGLDEFLFHSKTGFCEHYAGAMATLLRYLKIPARVVVGFQGGSQSYLADYVSIRGHNAHAWVEYLDTKQGHWQRVDPTMELDFVSPELNLTPSWIPKFLVLRYLQMRQFTDEVDARWNNLLLNADVLRPRDELITAVAQNFWWFFACVIGVLVSVLAVRRRRATQLTADEKIYQQLLRQLQKWDIEKTPQEGLLTLFEKVIATKPGLVQHLEPIFATLLQIRYGQLVLAPEEAQKMSAQVSSLNKIKA